MSFDLKKNLQKVGCSISNQWTNHSTTWERPQVTPAGWNQGQVVSPKLVKTPVGGLYIWYIEVTEMKR